MVRYDLRKEKNKMSTELATKEQSPLMNWLAEERGVSPAKAIELLKKQCFSNLADATDANIGLFLMTCRKYKLDPIAKQIHAFIGRNGTVQPIVGIDGWSGLANQNEFYDGSTFEYIKDDKGKLEAVSCKIYRKDRKYPTEVTEYLSECQGTSQQWQKWPARNLRHKAFIQCARLAFSFSGIIDDDEALRYSECEVKNTKNAREASLAALAPENVIDVTPVELKKENSARTEEMPLAANKPETNAPVDVPSQGKSAISTDARPSVVNPVTAPGVETITGLLETAKSCTGKNSKGEAEITRFYLTLVGSKDKYYSQSAAPELRTMFKQLKDNKTGKEIQVSFVKINGENIVKGVK